MKYQQREKEHATGWRGFRHSNVTLTPRFLKLSYFYFISTYFCFTCNEHVWALLLNKILYRNVIELSSIVASVRVRYLRHSCSKQNLPCSPNNAVITLCPKRSSTFTLGHLRTTMGTAYLVRRGTGPTLCPPPPCRSAPQSEWWSSAARTLRPSSRSRERTAIIDVSISDCCGKLVSTHS